jgi:recombination protein RecA
MRLDENGNGEEIQVVSTGSLGLDMALGVGGLPRGRVIEIYGPESSGKTTLTLETIAQMQKLGGQCAFVDAEHALDTQYAQKLGVNLSDVLISQPDNGEQALEIVDALVRSGAVDLIVIDSVAALTPKAEIEGDMGASLPGLQARLMSQALRKLTGSIKKTNCTVIFINQIRMKIGVMFGCFNYSSRVTLADGSSEKIGKIVNNKMDVSVLSWNSKTNSIEPKKIVNWFNNGKAKEFFQVEIGGGISGSRKMSVTENHMIFTPSGEMPVSALSVGDEVLVNDLDITPTAIQHQFIIGSALGDGSIRIGHTKGSLRYGQEYKQKEYLLFKHKLLNDLSNKVYENQKTKNVFFDTKRCHYFKSLAANFYSNGTRTVSDKILSEITPISMAAWYMDDGSLDGSHAKTGAGKVIIYNKLLSEDDKNKIIETVKNKFGISFGLISNGNGFVADSENSRKFQELVAPYIVPNLSYKIIESLHDKVNSFWSSFDFDSNISKKELKLFPEKITKKYIKPMTRSMLKFDIEVDGNHNYFVDNILVHNSPETTTGGNALKFYASVRLDIRRTGTIKKGEEAVGNETKVKVVKNKVSPPFKTAEFDIFFGEGISHEGEIIELGVLAKIIDKSGAWYAYKGEKIGQGKEKVRDYLIENPAIANEIEAAIRASYAPPKEFVEAA